MSEMFTMNVKGTYYPKIVCSNGMNSIFGSYYLKDREEVIVNTQNVNNVPTIISEDYVYDEHEYKCFTLAACDDYSIPHEIVFNEECEVNMLCIGAGSPGGLSGSTLINSNCAGGNNGGCLYMKFTSPVNSVLNVQVDKGHCIDTLKYLGEEKPLDEVVMRYNIDGVNNTFSEDTVVNLKLNNSLLFNASASSAKWPVQSTEPFHLNQTNTEGNSGVVTGEFIPDSIKYYDGLNGGSAQNMDGDDTSFGLSTGQSSAGENLDRINAINILGHSYAVPSGGGGGGGLSSLYSVNYNTIVNPFTISSNAFGGCAYNGGGFGNILQSSTDETPRIVDAWLPGCGGGGAFVGNRNGMNTNGLGGQGVVIMWIRRV